MLLRAGGGGFGLKSALAGFKRIDTHFSEAEPRITPVGLDVITAGWLEWDLTAAFPSIPPTISYVLMGFELQANALGVAGTLSGIGIVSSTDGTGPNIQESCEIRLTEQVGALAGALGELISAIKFKVHGGPAAIKVWRNLVLVGGGGTVATTRLLGYWD